MLARIRKGEAVQQVWIELGSHPPHPNPDRCVVQGYGCCSGCSLSLQASALAVNLRQLFLNICQFVQARGSCAELTCLQTGLPVGCLVLVVKWCGPSTSRAILSPGSKQSVKAGMLTRVCWPMCSNNLHIACCSMHNRLEKGPERPQNSTWQCQVDGKESIFG